MVLVSGSVGVRGKLVVFRSLCAPVTRSSVGLELDLDLDLLIVILVSILIDLEIDVDLVLTLSRS